MVCEYKITASMFITKISARRLLSATVLGLLMAVAPVSVVASACNPEAQSCSSQWQVTESFFGSGGQLSACGVQYCAKQSAGELAVGKVCDAADNKCLQAGFNTDRTPYLEFIIGTPSVNVGVLTPGQTHVGTATFQVKSYLANSYQVTTSSPGPRNGSYTMASPSTPTANAVGTEQFGMNVVANTCPVTAPSSGDGSCTGVFGANPSQQPDSTFSFGYAAPGYDTANMYQYVNNSVIARSDSSSGTTSYTISYLFNISSVTPGGTYTMTQSLVATSTF